MEDPKCHHVPPKVRMITLCYGVQVRVELKEKKRTRVVRIREMASMNPMPAMMPNTCPYNDTRVNVWSPSNKVMATEDRNQGIKEWKVLSSFSSFSFSSSFLYLRPLSDVAGDCCVTSVHCCCVSGIAFSASLFDQEPSLANLFPSTTPTTTTEIWRTFTTAAIIFFPATI